MWQGGSNNALPRKNLNTWVGTVDRCLFFFITRYYNASSSSNNFVQGACHCSVDCAGDCISPQIVGYRKFTASSVLALVASAVRHGTPVRALGALPHVLCWMRAVKACCAAATMVYLLEDEKHV